MEIWKDIPGFEGDYQVSSEGRVRSLDRIVHCKNGAAKKYKGRMLVLKPNVGGYLSLRLGRGNPVMVHQLVALVFIGPAPPGLQACHNSGDKNDNTKGNIRYDTPKNNQADRKAHGTELYGSRMPQAKLHEDQVREIKRMLGTTSQRAIGELYGVCTGTIGAIARGICWKQVPDF